MGGGRVDGWLGCDGRVEGGWKSGGRVKERRRWM